MRGWLFLGVIAALAACGCAGFNTLNEKTCERMFLPLMSDVEQAEYYRRPTWPERKAFLHESGFFARFETAPEYVRQAILRQEVVKGMTPEQVIMSWGAPADRTVIQVSDDPEVASIAGHKERWLYMPVLTPDFSIRYLRAVEFTNGVVLYIRDERADRRGG